MSTKTTTTLILLGTLTLGLVLGLVLSGTLAQGRRDQVERVRGPGGFVAHMERVIQPRDEAQWAALQPLLEAADARNREIQGVAEADIVTSLQEMALQIADLLDAEQQARLEREILRGRPPGPPPRGGGPPQRDGSPPPNRGGPPPDDAGPPPRGEGPVR